MKSLSVLEEIWRTYEMTDTVIVCCDGTVKSHRAILSAASPCLKEAMLDLAEDGEDIHIFLPESNVQDVISMLSLIYLGLSCVSLESQRGVIEASTALGLNLSWYEEYSYDDGSTAADAVPCDPSVLDFPLPQLTDDLFPATNVIKERDAPKRSSKSSHSCATCGKMFKTAGLLERHERIHSGLRPFECGICGMRFVRSHHLLDHERRHSSDAKTFRCPECAKTFSRRASLDVHLRTTHSNQKSFKCELCGKAFGRNDVLTRHKMLKHRGEGLPAKSDPAAQLPVPAVAVSAAGLTEPYNYFEDISVSSVMTSYENWETDFVLTADSNLGFH
ncbi:unnamed protein product [Notodromas monacha]|uniref:Uncharacterized protein n=1 Tax=Notodromas monacha TaxID=399045 RepID=A0A7R9BES6_9CRUS|nr:unnamed protein product [Notodromas monacha]CAG0913326.1 unnamed protein product [Notodromas monacha]